MNGFPDGFQLLLKGQTYIPIGVENFTRKNGIVEKVIKWHSECATCGAGFTMMTLLSGSGFNRRCSVCKKPGVPVRTERRRARQEEMRHK